MLGSFSLQLWSLILSECDFINAGSNSLEGDLDDVAIPEPKRRTPTHTHTLWPTPIEASVNSSRNASSSSDWAEKENLRYSRSRQNDIPRQQRRTPAREAHRLPDAKHHVPRPARLHLHPVHPSPDRQACPFIRIPPGQRFEAGHSRPQRRPPVEPLAQPPLPAAARQLPRALRHVVGNGEAGDVGERGRGGHVARGAADDDGELGFVVDFGVGGGLVGFLGHARDGDGAEGVVERGGRLVEEDRVGGKGHARLGGVGGVVEAEAADRARRGGGERAEEATSDGRGVGGDGVGCGWLAGRGGVGGVEL